MRKINPPIMDGSTTLLRVSLAEDNSLALLNMVSSKVAVKGTAVVTRTVCFPC